MHIFIYIYVYVCVEPEVRYVCVDNFSNLASQSRERKTKL